MKTLDEIVKRSDYMLATDALKQRAMDLAQVLLDKFIELDLFDYDGFVALRTRETNSYRGWLFCIYVENNFDNGTLRILNTKRATAFTSDDGILVCDARNEDFLSFLNKANALVQELDRIETEKTDEVQKSLSNLNLCKNVTG